MLKYVNVENLIYTISLKYLGKFVKESKSSLSSPWKACMLNRQLQVITLVLVCLIQRICFSNM